MSIYLGETLYSGGGAGGSNNGSSAVVMNTLYSGALANNGTATLTDSIRNYDFLVVIAGISGSANYQFSGFFSVADIPTSGTPQLYLSTPFELNADNTMKAYCGMVINIAAETTIGITSKYASWSSGKLFRIIGLKLSGV